jgi:RNA recognition motif-containing protein
MQCKGFGYILFRDQSMVALALRKMHESKYMKRDLRVTVCGKRFKGRKGQAKDDSKRRSFEGKRSGAAAEGAIKRILGKKPSKADEKASSKKRRARGETKKGIGAKGGPKSAGVSKRAVKEGKAGKRMKKIQKRISKGMGKTRGR